MLRTKLEFVNLERQARSIMVTSAVHGEGKTTTAVNLALALASSGSRVILCDLDAQNPQLAGLFGISDRPGIVDVALGRAQLDEALFPVAGQEVRSPLAASANGGDAGAARTAIQILPYGSVADGGDVLRAQPLVAALATLRERAEYVIVDAPPLLQVADALTLSARVDAIMLVARVGTIRRPMIQELRRLLETSSTPKLGVVITGASAASSGYGAYRQGPAVFTDQARAWLGRQRAPVSSGHEPR
jgi:non-specific protein-tyrosine kinase